MVTRMISAPSTEVVPVIVLASCDNAVVPLLAVARFDRDEGYKQMFFVCHTVKGQLRTDHHDVFVWTGPKVAEMALKSGLADWVLEKVK